jgi:predicted Zn finger-like uncharacterized protein
MVKIECDGCGASYQVDERRIPAGGLRMRCPKCSKSLLVTHEGVASSPEPPPAPRVPANPSVSDLPAVLGPNVRPLEPRGAPAPAFGSIDLGGPPAAVPGRHLSAHDLPVIRTDAAPPGKPARPRQQTMQGPGAFGQLDLTAPARPPPPAPAPPPAPGFGEIGLPVVPAAIRPSAAADLPSAKARSETRGFGEIDLPIVGGAGLPAPARGGDLPSAASVTGLPMVSRGVGLPSPAQGGTGLPSLSSGGTGLPMVGGAGLPAVGGAGLPAVGGAGLPAVGGAGLPAVGGALPSVADVGLPVFNPSSAGPWGVSSPRDYRAGLGGPPSSEHFGEEVSIGMKAPEPEAEEDDLLGPEVGQEISLGLSPERTRQALGSMSPAGGATAPAPPAAPKQGLIAHGSGLDAMPTAEESAAPRERSITSEPVGGEADLEAAPPPAPAAGAEVPSAQREVLVPKKKSPKTRYFVAAAVLLVIGGGSLALVPDLGAFGVNAISDKLSEGENASALATLRASTQKSLAEDTSAAADAAVAAARAAHEGSPRYRPLSAYAAFVVFDRGLRFGRRPEDETYAKQLLELVGPEAGSGDLITLAMAAQDASSGQLARARQALATLQQRLPNDVDVAVLAGEIELSAKTHDKAVEAWKKAVAVEKTARTLFGAARAALAAGDAVGAEAFAKEVMTASPKHVASRTLLASVLWTDSAREPEAVKLLSAVTEDAEVRRQASSPELVEAYTLLGRIHLGRSRMSQAEQAFAAALKLDPQAVQALVGNGELFYRSGRFSEALSRFEAANRADADSVVSKVGEAKTWLALERMKEAKDLLKKLRDAYPKDPLVAFWLGRAEDALGNRKESETAYLEAIKVGESRPEVVDAYVALGQLLSGLGRIEEASQKLGEASQKFPKSATLFRAKGEVLLATGRYDEAKKELEGALAIEEDLGTRFKLAVALRRMRAFDDAEKTLDQVAAVDKDYPSLALERGLLFEATGKTDKALEMYNEALRKAPNDVDLMLRVGASQVMSGHAELAEPILKQVVSQRPKSAEANHFYGRALLVMGTNLSEAMRYLEQSTLVDPNRAEYFLYVGWGANESGQPAKAQSALERALELDRNLGDAYWQRGVLLQKQGATLDALNDLRTALEKRPSRYEAYATMALCYQDQSKWSEAESAWRRAIGADGSVPEWHYRLGKILATRGNEGSSAPELEKAVTLVEASPKGRPAWLYDAHFLLAEAMRTGGNREKAITHYRRFLELAPTDNAYRADAEKHLEGWGIRLR